MFLAQPRSLLRVFILLLIALMVKTWQDSMLFDTNALDAAQGQGRVQLLDRNGIPLTLSYQNALNSNDIIALHQIPQTLTQAFIAAEDKRFFTHHGIDWQARISAVAQNIVHLHSVRGASTITEQVVRILHPRPRTLWSRWLEGIEACALERNYSKAAILEFYLNQVPFAANRRGIVQAARYYFNRELSTLSVKEMLALAVLPRAPSGYDLYRYKDKITVALLRLARAMQLPAEEQSKIMLTPFQLEKYDLSVDASHFAGFIRTIATLSSGKIITTLDSHFQQEANVILTHMIETLSAKQVHNGAVLVVDHTNGEILVWSVAGDESQAIDAVRTPRQAGSSMKPFLYARALDKGWNPATIIEDAPVTEKINAGLHNFNNYSHVFYGNVTLREALGNSLNIPAIHAIEYVGVADYLEILHQLGFANLTQDAEYYNEGLALGAGEVSLLELVQGYAALANRGVTRQVTGLMATQQEKGKAIYSPEAASLIGNILSDAWARQLEFGRNSVLNLPVPTAVKTGTSTDYHDAWAAGYNARYVVGVWLGNLDNKPMDGVTGSTGAALVLRSVFSVLNKNSDISALYLSPALIKQDICTPSYNGTGCFPRSEYFMPGNKETGFSLQETSFTPAIASPADGVFMAIDPRIPARKQMIAFSAKGVKEGQQITWLLGGKKIITTTANPYFWQLERGDYQLSLQLLSAEDEIHSVDSVTFHVK